MRLEKHYSENFMPYGSLSKPPVMESSKHLDWIRGRRCAVMHQEGVDTHHMVKKSQGSNDYSAIPLRHDIHMELHQKGTEYIETKYGIDLKEVLIATLCERVSELEDELRCMRLRS